MIKRATIIGAILSTLLGLSASVEAATLLPPGKSCFADSNGAPLAAGTINFYIPATTTPKNTYQDSASTILNTNPVLLDSAGCALIYGDGTYREIIKDSLGNLIWDQLTASTGNQTGVILYGGTSTGSANAQIISVSGFTATDGQLVSFIAGFTNTGATTIDAGTGGIAVRYDSPTGPLALTGNEIRVGNAIEALYVGGFFHLIGPPVPIQYQTTTNYQAFTASGTWTKPTFATSDAAATTHAECWGAGGGGGANATGGAGGGGGHNDRWLLTSLLGATETVTIPAGGAINTTGTDATFGTWLTACGGGAGQNGATGGGGGGGGQAAGINVAFTYTCRGAAGAGGTGGTGGGPVSPGLLGDGYAGVTGGNGGGSTSAGGGASLFGGGGGGYGTNGNGGQSVWGGGGGAVGTGIAGTSSFAGAGGATTVAGTAPAGGGGRNAAGGRGECRITTVP